MLLSVSYFLIHLIVFLKFSDVDDSIENIFSYSLNFNNCITTISCFSFGGSGNCTVQYSQLEANIDSSVSITGSLNSSFPLPLMESATLYYLKISFTLDFESSTLNTIFTTSSSDDGNDFCSVLQ